LWLATWVVVPFANAEPPGRARRHASITEGTDCGACHTPSGWKSLSGDGGGFDHSRTGFPLTGRHARAACTDCHKPDEQITRACNGCHRDPHERRLGGDCAECHSSQTFARVAAFERHRLTRLPLTGMHALAACTDCHRRTTNRQWRSVPADCFACHADDYRRTDVHPRHGGGQGTPPSTPFSHDCAQCHRANAWSPAVITPDAFGASESPLGLRAPAHHELLFPLRTGSHRGAACTDCHQSESLTRAVRCTGCHAHSQAKLRAQHPRDRVTLGAASCLHCHAGGRGR
jgi:hypothetical protein